MTYLTTVIHLVAGFLTLVCRDFTKQPSLLSLICVPTAAVAGVDPSVVAGRSGRL